MRDPTDDSGRPLLGLDIPRQAAPKADNMLLDIKETEAWFEALPMANIGETARQIYSTLVEFNRIELPEVLRAKAVEKFRPPAEYITRNLQKYYIDVGLPLSQKGWKTAALARELHKELAISYKIIIERMIGGEGRSFDRRLLIISLHRALYYLGQVLLQNALTYTAWPAGIWREINSIYSYAAQNRIHKVPVRADDGRRDSPSTTIEEMFKGLMLFASATPHRLRQSHARLLFANLLDWSHHTTILSEDDGGTSLGRFNVDLWTDAPPMHNSLRTPLPGRRIAILDVRQLLRKLRSDFENAPWDNRGGLQSSQPTLTRPLLRLLILAWSRPPDRRFVRTRLNFDLRVVAGLHAVYGNLKSDSDTPYSTTRTELFKLDETDSPGAGISRKIRWTTGSLDDVSLAPLDSDLVTDSLFTDSRLDGSDPKISPKALSEFGQPAKDNPSTENGDGQTAYPVKTLNESAGGYCLHWQGDGIPRVKIGELIGVESPSSPRSYGLGVIRWMKQLPDQSLDLGLEVISTRCEAADVREAGDGSSRSRSPAFKCLVVKDTDAASNATASLLLNAMSLKTGVDLLLSIGNNDQLIRLTRLIEYSSAFARYQFEFVKSENDGDDPEDRPGEEFSDLWGNL